MKKKHPLGTVLPTGCQTEETLQEYESYHTPRHEQKMFPQYPPPPPVVIVQPAVAMPSVWAPPQLVPAYHGYQPVPVWVPPPVVYQPMPTYTPAPQPEYRPAVIYQWGAYSPPVVCLPGGT